MTDPKRLLLEDGSEQERRMLQAGAAEQPPADGAARLALALGVPLAAPSSPPPTPGATGGELAKGASAKLLGGKLALKAALLASAAGALALTLTLRAPSPAPAPTSTRATATTPEATPAAEPNTSATQSADPAQPSLADEVARLDEARRALAARRPDAALGTLDAYRTSHPRGTLAPEALRLRVEAWLAKGDARRARELAREFLRAHPQSPHAATLRRIAEGRVDP